jgi:DMSO/TMAO reductase YedYZ molybdopterin-dependent catalytic subunit
MQRPGPPAPPTIRRRSLLEWLGSGVVLGLASPLLKACGAAGEVRTEQPDPRLETTAPTVDGTPVGFAFEPGAGDQGIAAGWPERTVDAQDLQSILASWRLRVDGLVEAPGVWSFGELLELPRQDQLTDFHCVEGWTIFDVPWNGLHLSQLARLVQPRPEATHVTLHTVGGRYNESLPLDVALEPRTLLGYGVEGHTLPFKTGFPLRVVVPRLYGYKNPKYVDRIEFTDRAIEGFWVARGYPYAGEVPPARLRQDRY